MDDKIISSALTFDDVAVVPGISEVPAHETETKCKLTKNIELDVPLLSAAMDTVTEAEMALAMAEIGGIGIIHRNLSIKEQAAEVKKFKEEVEKNSKKYKRKYVGAAIGTSGDFMERAEALIEVGLDVISIDLAHGSTLWARKAIIKLKEKFPELDLIAGNAATYEGVSYLADCGADAIKLGIGGGSICTTRVVTGVGVPNITAILEAKRAIRDTDISLIIDGGVRYSGDFVKAVVAGADFAMVGSLLAGTKEAPGEIVKDEEGNKYKYYRGMSVKEAMNKRTQDRYYNKEDKHHVSQGVTSVVAYKGKVEKIVDIFMGGVRSGMENVGAKNFHELYQKGRFYKVTNAGVNEAHPHDINILKDEDNYSRK